MPEPAPTDREQGQATISHLWEQPRLCLAAFGIQIATPEGAALWEASGIAAEMDAALAQAVADGLLLLNRPMMTPDGPIQFQYWRSHEDLAVWSRRLPHMAWWRWLLEHAGPDVSFYHEIYQVATAEAVYERGCRPVGPALFVSTSPVAAGEGRSAERQARFAEARGAIERSGTN